MILFGQLAGSASVDRYAYSWASDPIGSGFLMASGAAGFGEALPLNNAAGGYKVSDTLGCGTNNTNNNSGIPSCLQSEDIWEAAIYHGILHFLARSTKAEKFAQLPIVPINNDFEPGIFIAVVALENQTYNHAYWEDLTNRTWACPAGALANVSASRGLHASRYRWFENIPNTRIFTNPENRTYHCSEITTIWDTLPTGGEPPADTGA